VDYSVLDDGLGAAYERIAFSEIIKAYAERFGARKLLELNATFIAGIPGFNSCILAQDGYDVTITVHSRDYAETLEAWKLAGLGDRVKVLEWDDDLATPFAAGEFDMVWNHLVFEHYRDPTKLVREMARVSNNLVMNLTLNPTNIGFPLHWAYHKITRTRWDHGFIRNTLISTMKRTHQCAGLVPVGWGGVDTPPWIDTVDLQLGGSMQYVGGAVGSKRWVWASTNPATRQHPLVRTVWRWERLLPEWYRTLVAHHRYAVSAKRPEQRRTSRSEPKQSFEKKTRLESTAGWLCIPLWVAVVAGTTVVIAASTVAIAFRGASKKNRAPHFKPRSIFMQSRAERSEED
jgi:SAM-dependent methyltransferase